MDLSNPEIAQIYNCSLILVFDVNGRASADVVCPFVPDRIWVSHTMPIGFAAPAPPGITHVVAIQSSMVSDQALAFVSTQTFINTPGFVFSNKERQIFRLPQQFVIMNVQTGLPLAVAGRIAMNLTFVRFKNPDV
jgi:hypothetical protein